MLIVLTIALWGCGEGDEPDLGAELPIGSTGATGTAGPAPQPVTFELNGQTYTVSPPQANEACQRLKTFVDTRAPDALGAVVSALSRGRISDESVALGQVAVGIADAQCPEFEPPPDLVDQLNAAAP